MDADILVFDPEVRFVLGAEEGKTREAESSSVPSSSATATSGVEWKHPNNSPYVGKEFVGLVIKTFLRGQCIFANGAVVEDAHGQVLL